jgi:hypothetical protein
LKNEPLALVQDRVRQVIRTYAISCCARSFEIAARLRGGRAAFGWLKALRWDTPMALAFFHSSGMLRFSRSRKHPLATDTTW